MGAVFRRFWLPALMSRELPEADCPPIRLRLLSEDLVAFRDSSGRPGFVAENCPHRGASLFFGRNEELGIRCVYHGWKFDASGACVDMPNEPPESNFKHKVRVTAYPAAERAGVIWIYMGPADLKPELPDFEWCFLLESQRVVNRWEQDCNYAQAVEGDLDTTHLTFLHSRLSDGQAGLARETASGEFLVRDGAPRLTARETDYGFCYGARRRSPDGFYWRVTQLLLPGYSIIPSVTSRFGGGLWLPMDDEHSIGWRFAWDYQEPFTDEQRPTAGGVPLLPPGSLRTLSNLSNDYLIDREMQRTENFTGIADVRAQDTMATETMGPIMDRTKEHLGTADLAIIVYRRRLLKLARDLEQGIEPFAATHGASYRVRSLDVVDPAETLDELLRTHERSVFQPAL
jgi:nitrite reductase/ring-hydroxylating ferredoxin subunit